MVDFFKGAVPPSFVGKLTPYHDSRDTQALGNSSSSLQLDVRTHRQDGVQYFSRQWCASELVLSHSMYLPSYFSSHGHVPATLLLSKCMASNVRIFIMIIILNQSVDITRRTEESAILSLF